MAEPTAADPLGGAAFEPPSYRRLSVVVPVYNERNTVIEIVRRMRSVELPLELEIVIVDDGSDDGTRRDPPAAGGQHRPRGHAPDEPRQGRRDPHRLRPHHR